MRQDQSKSLIDLLIKEFRVWETLLRLTREERRALLAEDMPLLAALASQKERLFGELRSCQRSRQELLKYLLGPQSCQPDYLKCLAMQTILADFTPEETGCLLHITEGIELVAELLEDLTRGNYALADCAMKRAWALKTWLHAASKNSLASPLTEVIAARSLIKAGNLA